MRIVFGFGSSILLANGAEGSWSSLAVVPLFPLTVVPLIPLTVVPLTVVPLFPLSVVPLFPLSVVPSFRIVILGILSGCKVHLLNNIEFGLVWFVYIFLFEAK
jgi:hypothetical protein